MTSRQPGHVTTPTPLPVDVGCGQLSVDDVWVNGFAKLMTESALRLLDVSGDGVLDVLLGFATGQRSDDNNNNNNNNNNTIALLSFHSSSFSKFV